MSHTKCSTGCLYFREVVNQTTYPIRGYCEGASETGLQVPTVAELQLFCLTGNYRRCPVYRLGTDAAGFPEPQPSGK